MAPKQFQCLPMLGEHHVSGRKAVEKSQPPAVGGSKSANAAEVGVVPSPRAVNVCLSRCTSHCTEDIWSTKTRPRHLSFPLTCLSKLNAAYLEIVSLMTIRKSEMHWNYKIKLLLYDFASY